VPKLWVEECRIAAENESGRLIPQQKERVIRRHRGGGGAVAGSPLKTEKTLISS
jgi:hypothetical protein